MLRAGLSVETITYGGHSFPREEMAYLREESITPTVDWTLFRRASSNLQNYRHNQRPSLGLL
jgi:hypothetical protein